MNEFLLLADTMGIILMVTSLLGLFFVKKKKFLLLLSILLFSFVWRCISRFPTSRYYCIFIVYGLFLSAFSAKILLRMNKMAFYALIIAIFSVHLFLDFSTFNNVYILDLQEMIGNITHRHPNDSVFVFSKEKRRLNITNNNITNEKTELLLNDVTDDLTKFYIKNSYFPNSLFCFISEPHSKTRITSSLTGTQLSSPNNKYTKIGLFFRNSKHKSIVSVYKHEPYTPSPVPYDGLDHLLERCTLKAYVPEYDAFIYLNRKQIIWLIGCEDKLWVTFRLHFDPTKHPDQSEANESDKENEWVDFGFTNNNSIQYKQIGKYHIFKRDIPQNIDFKTISCAFNCSKGTIRTRQFTVLNDASSQPYQVQATRETGLE